MKQSDNINELLRALVSAQAELHSPAGDLNVQGHKIASLNAFIEATRVPLANHGLVLVQSPSYMDTIVGVSRPTAGVEVETFLFHTSGQYMSTALSCTATRIDESGELVPSTDADSVSLAVTRMRKAGLKAILNIAQTDDEPPMQVQTPAKISQEQAETIRRVLGEVQAEESSFLAWAQATSIEAIQASQYERCIEALEKKR